MIGFEVIGSKEDIFKIMLQSIAYFTITDSNSNIFYKNTKGDIYKKTYHKVA